MSYAQGCTANAHASAILTGTFTNPTMNGNTIIVAVGYYNDTTVGETDSIVSVVDNNSNSVILDPITPYNPQAAISGNGYALAAYRLDNIVGRTGHTITITMSNPFDYPSAVIMEFGGRATNSFDTSNVSTDYPSAYTNHLGTNLTTIVPNDDLAFITLSYGASTGLTFTPTGGWNTGPSQTFTQSYQIFSQYKNNVAAGAYITPFITNNFVKNMNYIIALKPSTPKIKSWVNFT